MCHVLNSDDHITEYCRYCYVTKDQFFISDAVLCNCVLVTGTSQTNTCDWLVKNMTGGCLEVDLENVTGDDLAHIRLAVEDWSSYGGVH